MAEGERRKTRRISFGEMPQELPRTDYMQEISMLEEDPPVPPLPRMKPPEPVVRNESDALYKRVHRPIAAMSSAKSLMTEYNYFMHTLSSIIPLMSKYGDIITIRRWVTVLLGAEFKASPLLHTTNKLLLHMTIGVVEDKILNLFQTPPTENLADLELHTIRPLAPDPPARWQQDTFWDDLLLGSQQITYIYCGLSSLALSLPQSKAKMTCPIHENCVANIGEGDVVQPVVGMLMDKEFKFFLHLSRPYASLIMDPNVKSVAALWLQTLASIPKCSCLYLKGIRNDYMQAMLGYLQDLRPVGMFSVVPPEGPLIPLAEMAKIYGKNTAVSENRLAHEAEAFLAGQPTPEDGAFCYVAVSGDLEATNIF
ncbi:hypothetical protein AAG570_002864 [Ranatra chinensis]|uniref:DUF4485 domain-containing protein n=1 Tax=Ranatra chinensis TaxID=642074 RepID=A0ABD0YTK6_9HEMI